LEDVVWIRMSYISIALEDLEDARKLYQSEFISGVIKSQPGYRFHYWLESAEQPGDVISLTAWDSQSDGEAYERSGVYSELGSKLRQWFHTERVLRSYEVRD
jgi:heme-degrading monooxygenase HmoA